MRQIAYVLLAVGLIDGAMAGPRAGSLDPSFGEGKDGLAIHGFDIVSDGDDHATAFVSDAQGRLYLAGSVQSGEDTRCLGIARFSPDGVVDPQYAGGASGCLSTDPLASAGNLYLASDAVIDADGLLLVGGTLRVDDALQAFVCRFLQDGQPDVTFNPGPTSGCRLIPQAGDVEYNVPSVFLAMHGTVTVVAINHHVESAEDFRPFIARLDSNGQLVPFADNDLAEPFDGNDHLLLITDLAISATGNYLLAGADLSDTLMPIVAAVDATTGTLAQEFNATGYRAVQMPDMSVARSMSVGKDGSITVAGDVDDGAAFAFRLTSDGAMDATFQGGDARIYSYLTLSDHQMQARSIQVSPSGHILLGGTLELDNDPAYLWALRLRDDGTPDPGFGSTVPGQTGYAFFYGTLAGDDMAGLVLQGERPVIGATLSVGDGGTNSEFALFRLADGSLFRDEFEAIP